ncbi:MAG: hypothetical protein IOD15_01110 [Phycisphaerales bacterium]|nr:hypothetical protein [Phycisphaerales bacterium]
MHDPYATDPPQRPWPSEDPVSGQHPQPPEPASSTGALVQRDGGMSDRDRQMMEMAYATGRAQAMAEAAMHAANAANYNRYHGPPAQTHVYVQQRPSSLSGCGMAIAFTALVIAGGFGFLFLPLNPIVGGVILGTSLLGLTACLVVVLK